MAYAPIAFTAPNYRDNANEWIKAYEPGTTTPKVMALESNGGTQVAKLQLNADGFIVSAGAALVIPYMSGAYDLWLFPTEAEADANNTANAIRLADNILGVLTDLGIEALLINDLSQAYEFATVSEMLATTVDFPDGKVLHVLDNNSDYTKLSGSTTVDGVFILKQTALNNSFSFNVQETVYAEKLGIVPGAGQTAEISTFLTYIYLNKLKGVMLEGQYDVDTLLLSEPTTSGKFKLVCQVGEATFNYTGLTELTRMITARECEQVDMKNITFNCNELVNVPLELLKTSSIFGGTAVLSNVNSHDAKEIATSNSGMGLFLGGSYKTVKFESCTVTNVTYTTAGRDATGIVLNNFGGAVEFDSCNIRDITTPFDSDGDGIKVFGTDVTVITNFLGATAEVHNCVFSNCQGRFIKMQMTNFEVHGCQFKIPTGSTTITEFRAIDAQYGNGNVHDNSFLFGSGITWGTAATIMTTQCLRNDGNEQVTRFQNNKISCQTADLSVMVGISARYGDNEIIITGNKYLGEPVKKGFSLRIGNGTSTVAQAILDTDSVGVVYEDNTVEDYGGQDMWSIFDDVDYGDLIYFTIKNNRVKNKSSTSRLDGSGATMTINGNFSIANNQNTADRINWTFDMNDVEGENSFWVGGQAISNQAPGITSFSHVQMDGLIQRAFNTGATAESRRSSLNGNTWYTWVTV